MEIAIGFWIMCGIFSAVIASSKGRSGCGWLVIGFIFGLFALIAVAAMPAVQKEGPIPAQATPAAPAADGAERAPCQWCLELVRIGARVCPHCRRDDPIDMEALRAARAEVAAREAEEPVVVAYDHDGAFKTAGWILGTLFLALIIAVAILRGCGTN